MKPPYAYKLDKRRGYSKCMGCDKWTLSNALFKNEGINWNLCEGDFEDYWFNEDEVASDFKRQW